MIDFNGIPDRESDEDVTVDKIQLDIGRVLENIDTVQYDFYDNLNDKEKKLFTPYTVLRWVSSLDDSIQVTYKAKDVEAVFGKWSTTGKDALNELKDEFNSNSVYLCTSVAKYEHAKYDWRIKFAVKDKNSANNLIETIKEFGINNPSIISLVDSTTMKNQLVLLNDFVNVNFWDMSDHPELLYQLMCSVSDIVGPEKRVHNWLPFIKGKKNMDLELFEIIKNTLPPCTATQLDESEYKIIITSYDNKEFDALLKEFGYQDSDRKSLLKKFKSEKEKYGKK